jgi:hypothetical protein
MNKIMEKINVTKERFDAASNNHKPNWLIKNYWRFFSKDTINTDKWVKRAFIISLMVLFFLGFFSTVFNASRLIIGVPTTIYGILLSLVVLPGFIAFKMNQGRTTKIAKELGVSLEEYNALVTLYYGK